MTKYLETRLECDHIVRWLRIDHIPEINTKVYCYPCQDMRKVSYIPGAFTAKCMNCSWHCTRLSHTFIMKQVTLHLTKNRQHLVTTENYIGKKSIVRLRDSSEQMTLDDVPPF